MSTLLTPGFCYFGRTGTSAANAIERAVEHFSQMLFLQRLRTPQDRQQLMDLYQQCWGRPLPLIPTPELTITPARLQLGWAALPRTHAQTGSDQPASPSGERSVVMSLMLQHLLFQLRWR